ncbi:hypothetical protein [Paracoccus angustae]
MGEGVDPRGIGDRVVVRNLLRTACYACAAIVTRARCSAMDSGRSDVLAERRLFGAGRGGAWAAGIGPALARHGFPLAAWPLAPDGMAGLGRHGRAGGSDRRRRHRRGRRLSIPQARGDRRLRLLLHDLRGVLGLCLLPGSARHLDRGGHDADRGRRDRSAGGGNRIAPGCCLGRKGVTRRPRHEPAVSSAALAGWRG